MARTKLSQRSASRVDVPMGATGGRPPSKILIAMLVLSIITAIWAAAMLTPFGRVGYYYLYVYSEFYMGVLTLVSLSVTIMLGLVATDRLVLSIRQRVLLQSAHRTTGVIAVASLVVHVWTKTIEQHIRTIDIVVPFLAPYNTVYVGLGTLSGWIMMLVMWTGLARARFVGRRKPWMWRTIHATSYLMWPIALVHGLAAGRSAATWVIVSYVVCLLFVLVALAVRLSVSLNRRKDFASSSAGSVKPVGALAPPQSPTTPKRRMPARAGRDAAREQWIPAHAGRDAVREQWMPAASVRASAPQVSPRPAPVSPAPAGPSPYARYLDDEDIAVGDRRYAADTDAGMPRPRRSERDRYDERTGAMSRRAREGREGRHSRSDFVDLATPQDPWRGQADPDYVEPDETPTLVDIAARRARRQAQPDGGRTAGRRARRGATRSRTIDELEDPRYWRQLRGEAQ